MLCVSFSAGDDPKAARRRVLVESQAKRFFLRYYVAKKQESREGENSALRSFLENKVLIPDSWFEEALALSCAYDGDIVGHVTHLVASDQVESALKAAELIILPESLIMGEESSGKLKHYLETLKKEGLDNDMRWNVPNGCGATLDFLTLSEEIKNLLRMPRNELQEQVDNIINISSKLRELRSRIIDPTDLPDTQPSVENKYIENHQFSSLSNEERYAAFAVASANLSILQMKIRSLLSKIPYEDTSNDNGDTTSDIVMGSQLAFLAYSQKSDFGSIKSGGLFSNSMMRGVTGGFVQ